MEDESIQEHNGDLPPVVASSVQVTDIIDEMGTSVASSAIDSSGCDHDLTLRGTIEDTAIHEEDKAQHEVVKPKDKDVVEGTQEDSRPMDGYKPQDVVEDKPRGVTGADGLLSSEDNKCLSEQYEEETLVIHEEEDIMSFESDKENGEEYLSDENELKKSVSPSGGHFESNREQPGTEGRPEISRHSYSRYDTVSYRKIRKGNTKQRIDEFESMMNL